MSRYLVQCAFVWFYVPFSRSMFLRLFLWTVISFNVPSFYSIVFYLVQCFFFPFYFPFSFYLSFYFCLFCCWYCYLSFCLNFLLWCVLSFYVSSFYYMCRSLF